MHTHVRTRTGTYVHKYILMREVMHTYMQDKYTHTHTKQQQQRQR